MTRWEYRLADFPLLEGEWGKDRPAGYVSSGELLATLHRKQRAAVESLLAELGAEGWELVSTRDLPRADGTVGPVLVFKRPAGGEA